VAHNYNGKRITVTSRQKEKPHGKKKKTQGKKNNLMAKRRRLTAKRKPHGKKEKTHGRISSMPRGQFYSYFFCREVVVILFVVSLFLARVFFLLS